jgi:hypothetical protein
MGTGWKADQRSKCFIPMHENGMRSVQIILKSGKMRKSKEAVNLIKRHYTYAWKYHNEMLVDN